MKRNIIILTLVALFFTGCRKEADYYPYIGENGTLAYNTYASQFDYLWKCISMGYVFWDIEKTDWDAVYDELMPQFEALDAKYKAGGDVTVDDLETLYNRALGGMVDHHMTVVIRNIHPSPNDTKPYAAFRPGQAEVATRDYYFESVYNEKVSMRAFLDGIDGQYSLAAHQTATVLSPALGDSVTYLLWAALRMPLPPPLSLTVGSLPSPPSRVRSWLESSSTTGPTAAAKRTISISLSAHSLTEKPCGGRTVPKKARDVLSTLHGFPHTFFQRGPHTIATSLPRISPMSSSATSTPSAWAK